MATGSSAHPHHRNHCSVRGSRTRCWAKHWVVGHRSRGNLAPCPRKATTADGKKGAVCCQRGAAHPVDCQTGWAEDGEQPKGKMGLFQLSSLSSPFKELPEENLFQSYCAWQWDLYQHVNGVLGCCRTPRFHVPADPFWVHQHTLKGKMEFSRKGNSSHTLCHYAGLQALPHQQLTPHTVNHAEHTKLCLCLNPLHSRKFIFFLNQITNSFLYRLVTLHGLQTPNQKGLLCKTLPRKRKNAVERTKHKPPAQWEKQIACSSRTLENLIS